MYSTYLFYFTTAISLLLTLYTNDYNKMYALFMFAFNCKNKRVIALFNVYYQDLVSAIFEHVMLKSSFDQ